MLTTTLIDLLRARADQNGSALAFTFLLDGENLERTLSYEEIDRRARAIGTQLASVCMPGDRVLLLYPPGLEFIEGFFGCLYAGVVAVPAYPPDPSRLERTLPRLQAIAADAGAKVVATTAPLLAIAEMLFAQAPALGALRWVATDTAPGDGSDWKAPRVDGETVAFLQYTSGSTGTPKGVVLSHGNLLHNEGMINRAFEMDERSIVVGWLPQYHDMGLIGNVIQPLYAGGRCVLMSPLDFLLRPMRWLRAISKHRGTTGGGPNFAFDLCVRKSTPAERAEVDLSSWQLAFTGAEPIRAETMRRFVDAFGPSGFRMESFYPCYGLAEASLIVSGGLKSEPPVVTAVVTDALSRDQVVERSGPDTQPFVSSGRELPGESLLIVDVEHRTRLERGRVGEIWVASPSVARGYWQQPERSAEVFGARLASGEGPYLRTGDLGFMRDGELFVTGRLKDLIILRGRNLYPQDIEATVEAAHPALRAGCTAAFSIDEDGEERLVIVQEVDRKADEAALDEAIDRIRAAVVEEHEAQAAAIVLIDTGSISKTTSGKIQRHASKRQYLAGELKVRRRSARGSEPPPADGPARVAPAAGLEQRLASIAAALLQLSAATIDAGKSLAAYGLDSLGTVELRSAIEDELGKTLPLEALLRGPSIRELAALIDRAAAKTSSSPVASSSSGALTAGEHALWLLHELEPDSSAYHLAAALRVVGALDAAALERALGRVIERNPSLRTTIEIVDGAPRKRVHAAPLPGWWSRVDVGGREERALASAEAQRPFDLARGGPLRVVLHEAGGAPTMLVVVLHHIASDLWSIALLVKQLGEAYAAERSGAALVWKPAPLRDLAVDEDALLASEPGRAQLAYWRERLAGELPILALPTDSTRPRGATGQAAWVRFTIDDATTTIARALGAEQGATLFAVLLAAYVALLERYTRQRDLLIGVPFNGRTSSARAEQMGYLVNMMPLRVQIAPAQPFASLLGEVRTRVVEALANQEAPFSRVLEGLALGGQRGRTPIFRTTFALQRLPTGARDVALTGLVVGEPGARLALGGLVLESTPTLPRDAQFDLVLQLAERDGGLAGFFEYDTSLFEHATVQALAASFGELLRGLGRELPLGRVPLLADAERRQLAAWNDTTREYPDARLIHERVAAQAKRTPDAIALSFEGRGLGYAELDRRANQLAHYLRRRGVGPETLVGLCVERSFELVIGLLGILKAGAAYVPLDPSYPAERLAYMLADAKPRVLLTTEKLGANEHAEAVYLDRDWSRIAEEPTLAPAVAVRPAGLAYMIYTSGSTGRPKGAMNSHAGILNRLLWMQAEYALGAGDVVLQKTPFSFDVSVWELFWPLMTGARLVLAKPGGHQEPAYLADLLEREQVTTLHFVPSMLAVFLDEPALDQRTRSVRQVMCSGEALPYELQQRFFAKLPPSAALHNLYGPTEAAVDVTYWPCARDSARRSVPIGRPVANTRMYVLDDALDLAPRGAMGELYIAGVQVGRGYLGRADLTAERFVPDPFAPEPGARMYRTGDLGRWAADGALEYLGRVDHQVKLRGFRIELGEIESALASLAGVRAATVIVRDDGGEKRLVAYVVGDVEGAALKAQLKTTLPDYMVPSAIVQLAALPLTQNGKLDRAALPAPDRGAEARAYVAPRTATEEIVARAWAEVLRVARVGADDDFFALGGHSLLATQVVSRVQRELGIDLSVRALFEAPTVAAFASRAAAARRHVGPVLETSPRGERTPLSFAQERLWFLDQLERGSAAYIMSAAVRLKGALDVPALRRSLEEVVRRHENLRTIFVTAEGRPYACVHATATFELPVEDLPAGEDPLLRARKEWERPFDLATGPLLRCRLLRRSPAEHVLLVTMHHIVSDGWSVGLLVRELGALYDAFHRGKPSPLAALPLQYADYAAWQRRWLQGEALERELSYWKGQLSGAPALLELPTDRPRPAVQTFAGRRMPVSFDAELTRGLVALAQAEGATLYMTLLAAWQVLLSRYSGQLDVSVGSPIANRTRQEVEGLIGFFVNMLVLRTDLGGRPSFREVLRRVKHTTVEAYAHQELPFEQVVEAVNPERSMSHAPLFQVTFGLANGPAGELALSGLSLETLEPESVAAKFDLVLNLGERDGALAGALEYATDLFDEATVRRMMEGLRMLLAGVLAAPDAPIVELPLLPAAEKRQIEAWSRGPEPTPGLGVLEAIDRLGRERADDPAVAAAEKTLRFGAFTARAGGVANALREARVGAEGRVGLFFDRRVEMPVAMLGCWYAGAAYVPFEPATPLARMRTICERAEIACVLTTRALAARLEGLAVRMIFVDELAEQRVAPVPLAADALAYILYTSGSTGEPKGVAVSHGSLANLAGALHERIYAGLEARLGARPLRVAVNASYSFDSSVKQWVMLARGHAVSIVPEEARYDGRALLRFLGDERIDALDLTPAQLRPVLELDGKLPAALLIGGEAIDAALWARLAALRGVDAFDVYGPTECTVDSTIARVQGASPTIGSAVAGVSVYVLDAAYQRVPVGVTGELCIGGRGVARGYLARPDLTAERFVPDPFATTPGARMYRSGDLGRYRRDGSIDFVGRVDHQVKVRGFRIELGEIESALGRVAGVREAVVVAREEGEGKRLVAYFVGAPEPAVAKARLEETLPEYMVPSAFMRLDALPRTPNGKIDRVALPAPQQAASESGHVAPRNPAEELIAAAWVEVLGLDRVGVHDDFFELGGHSLLATQVISRVQAGLDVEIPVSALFEAPTVAGLAERVALAKRSAVPTLEPMDRGERPPLSFAQERLWFLEQLEPGSSAYHVPAIIRLVGRLDVEALRRTLEEVVRRHESLRTTFAVYEGQPYQEVHACERFELPVEVLDGRDAMEIARRTWAQPFDLSRSPQVAARLLRAAEEEHVLVVTMHHIVSDGWSTGVLIKEVAPLYQAFLDGAPSPLPPLPLQYADYAVWQRKWLQGEVLDAQLAYWKTQLAGAPPVLELPVDRPRPAVHGSAARRVDVAFSAEQTRAINRLGREAGATLYMTLLAAWQLLLSRYSGQQDIVVGSPIANRTREQVEGLIGFFANTLVLRTQVEGRLTFRELLERVKRTTLEAYEHQEVPFERVVEALNPRRSLSYTPLFQVLFVLQNAPMGAMHLPGLELAHVDPEREIARFDLTLALIERDGALVGTLEYATAMFDEVTVLGLLDSFHSLLDGAARNLDACAAELPILSEPARVRLAMGRDYERAIRFPLAFDYFVAQARATPDAIAVVDAGRRWTYRELDERASRIAGYLQAHGVGVDDRVALALERGVDVAAATLGVWKAGAVCVPIEPANPAMRVRQMLEEGGVRVALTHARLRPLVDGGAARVVELDRQWSEVAAAGPPVARGHADCLAYVIYTSGSTGKPKGVAVPQRVLCNLVDTQLATLPKEQRTLQFASLGFDVSYQELIGTLAAGGTLYFIDDDVRLDLERLGAFVSEHAIERMHLPVVMLQQLAERYADEAGALAGLRDVIVAGEQLMITEAVVRLFQRLPQARLHNHYGPSETHLTAVYTLQGAPATWPSRAPIGERIQNGVVRVLDRGGGLQPRGAIGELYLGGTPVARGYFGRPDLTAERFVPDAYADQPGARMYRSGDLVRVRPDGMLEYLGRADRQVKIRGFRIELGEIEAALGRVVGVREAVVIAREEAGEKRLVAYVVGEAPPAALRAALKVALPDFMVPSAFISLDVLPVNVNGKVDRAALPAPASAPVRWTPPETETQRVLCEVWQEVLRVPQVGIDDNYFELGGDSIRSVQVTTKARARGLALAVRDLFDSQTIRELAAVVRPLAAPVATGGDASGLSQAQADALRARLKARTRTKGGPRTR